MDKRNVKKLVLAAVFLGLGFVFPFITGQIKEIGDTLLPMHLPVMLCGLICGANYGFLVGLILPFLRSVTIGMPPIFPNAVWMALELATYGFVIGAVYSCFKVKDLKKTYISLIAAMLSGRIVWGVAKTILLSAHGKTFSFLLFITGGFIDALPGIILQLIIIPLIIEILNRRRIIN